MCVQVSFCTLDEAKYIRCSVSIMMNAFSYFIQSFLGLCE